MNSDSNGSASRDMAAPAPMNKVTPHKLWMLELLFSLLALIVIGTFISIRDAVYYFMKTKKSVKGKVVVITGTGRGLGRGVALQLSRLGAYIACVDINSKNNEETVSLIRQQGGKAQAFTVNVAKSQQVDQLSKDVTKTLGAADIIVNNAALVMAVPMEDMSYQDIRAFYEINCMAAAFMCKAFLPEMRKRNSGQIVSISSIAAKATIPWLSLYCSTKAALSKFMDTLNVELNTIPGNRVKLTTIHPYFINTSADYFDWFRASTPILQEDTVVDAIVDALLWEKHSVFIPSFLSIINLLDGILPLHYHNLNIKFLGKDLNIPKRKERESLPYGEIVNKTVSETAK